VLEPPASEDANVSSARVADFGKSTLNSQPPIPRTQVSTGSGELKRIALESRG
jgi:hypothetical protein